MRLSTLLVIVGLVLAVSGGAWRFARRRDKPYGVGLLILVILLTLVLGGAVFGAFK